MANLKQNLLSLDINMLFENYKIEEIIKIGKLLDTEIEKKRTELRSMVGDRYKDILTASDSIKCMESISEEIVKRINIVSDSCEILIGSTNLSDLKDTTVVDKEVISERILLTHIQLAILINEEVWMSFDYNDNLKACQLYLLAKHIQTVLSLEFPKHLEQIPLVSQINENLQVLRQRIFKRITKELESVELSVEETCSNLNGLMLLESQSSEGLLKIFIEHRKTALNTVITNSYPSVRLQVAAMVRCLITTIYLLYDCFIYSRESNKKGLIWRQLEDIVNESSSPTLSKVDIPDSPLNCYIPETIKGFRPRCELPKEEIQGNPGLELKTWLSNTKKAVKIGLKNSLELVTTIKGLHIIREEALKIEQPANWQEICQSICLENNFSVWYYFFQDLITNRAQILISKKIDDNIDTIKKNIDDNLKVIVSLPYKECDLRQYMWSEEEDKVSHLHERQELTLKSLGFSNTIDTLCKNLDEKFEDLLSDICQYLYGIEFDGKFLEPGILKDYKFKRKYDDQDSLEKHLKEQSIRSVFRIIQHFEKFLELQTAENILTKSLFFARTLDAITKLCPCYKQCCCFNCSLEEWNKACHELSKNNIKFLDVWVDTCVQEINSEIKVQLENLEIEHLIVILTRWDVIEIQEQTEEEKVFKSEIKVPLKPSLALETILNKMNERLCSILPHTLPKTIHWKYLERNVQRILDRYLSLASATLNQNQSLQCLFDVKFVTTLCVPRDNARLIKLSQDICDKLRSKIDPFDLDVFYSYLQNNVKRAVIKSQVILGCLMPSSNQLSNLGIQERNKDQEKNPSIMAISHPSSSTWFPLLPITAPSQKHLEPVVFTQKDNKVSKPNTTPKRVNDPSAILKSSASSLFGGLATDWFS